MHDNAKENTQTVMLKVGVKNGFSVRANVLTGWWFAPVEMSLTSSHKRHGEFTVKFFGSICDCNERNSDRQFAQDNIIRPKIVAKKMETGNMVAENLYHQWHSFNSANQ
jgi:hypothetical protein